MTSPPVLSPSMLDATSISAILFFILLVALRLIPWLHRWDYQIVYNCTRRHAWCTWVRPLYIETTQPPKHRSKECSICYEAMLSGQYLLQHEICHNAWHETCIALWLLPSADMKQTSPGTLDIPLLEQLKPTCETECPSCPACRRNSLSPIATSWWVQPDGKVSNR